MIYLLAVFVPPLGPLFNGQHFSAIFNVVLTVFCLILGLDFNLVLLAVTVHALIAVHMKREQRMYWEVVEAIRRHGVPPG